MNHGCSPTELAWLAGIIDGEGSITIARSKARGNLWYVPHVGIANTDPGIITGIARTLDSLGVSYHASAVVSKGHLGKKEAWQIIVHRFASLEILLQHVEPYMKSYKKARAELMLRWIQERLPKRGRGKSNADRAYTPSEHALVDELRATVQTTLPTESWKRVKEGGAI